jgi:hypothetical protein
MTASSTSAQAQPTCINRCSHSEAVGTHWGDSLTSDRQAERQAARDAWNASIADYGDRRNPFDQEGRDAEAQERIHLTGADVFWIAIHGVGDYDGSAPWLRPERADLRRAHLEGVHLRSARLKSAGLSVAHLEHARLNAALPGGADLRWAHLDHAVHGGAYLWGARLNDSHLEGAHFGQANLDGADLRGAWMGKTTDLSSVTCDEGSVDQLHFESVTLAVFSWDRPAMLGDEIRARARTDDEGRRNWPELRLTEHEPAVRAQGIVEQAERFTCCAQLMQRGLLFQRRQFGRWLVSWGRAPLSDYKLCRIFLAYATVVLTFATPFLLPTFLNGSAPSYQQTADALQISLYAANGRVFFVQFGLDTLQSWLAIAESVTGIVFEGVFVAMIIQRLFR